MDDKKASIIACASPFDGHDRESWPAMIDWLVGHVMKIERVFDKEVSALRTLARTQFPRDAAA